jgi:hypothetical protein
LSWWRLIILDATSEKFMEVENWDYPKSPGPAIRLHWPCIPTLVGNHIRATLGCLSGHLAHSQRFLLTERCIICPAPGQCPMSPESTHLCPLLMILFHK